MGVSARRSFRFGKAAVSTWGTGLDSLSRSSLLIPIAAIRTTATKPTSARTGLANERRRRNRMGARFDEANFSALKS